MPLDDLHRDFARMWSEDEGETDVKDKEEIKFFTECQTLEAMRAVLPARDFKMWQTWTC